MHYVSSIGLWNIPTLPVFRAVTPWVFETMLDKTGEISAPKNPTNWLFKDPPPKKTLDSLHVTGGGSLFFILLQVIRRLAACLGEWKLMLGSPYSGLHVTGRFGRGEGKCWRPSFFLWLWLWLWLWLLLLLLLLWLLLLLLRLLLLLSGG